MIDSRPQTNRLIRMMDDGILSPDQVSIMCLGYMSEDDVADMMEQNDLLEDIEYESE